MEIQLKVMTYNVRVMSGPESRWPWQKRFWLKRLGRIVKEVKEEAPDVLLLQELENSLQAATIDIAFSDYIKFYAFEKPLIGEGTAVYLHKKFSSYKVTQLQKIKFSTGRVACVVELTIAGVSIAFMSVHLEGEELKEIPCVSEVDIVGGDFNVGHDMVEALLLTHERVPMLGSTTFVGFNDKEKPEAIIDHIVYRSDKAQPEITVAQGSYAYTVGTSMCSDHLAVVTNLIVRRW